MSYLHAHQFSILAGNKKILDQICIEINTPSLTVILGQSGAGKSTLAKAFTGQLHPSQRDNTLRFEGPLSVLDRPIEQWALPELGSKVGFVFQHPIMFPGSVKENLVDIPNLAIRKPDRALDDEGLQVLLDAYGLGQIDLAMNAEDLSGGQQQRLAILRASIMRPQMLVLDEITSGLDDPVSLDIIRLIHAEAAKKPVILITHDTRLVAWADRVIVMENGRVEFDGPANEARAPSAPLAVRLLLDAGEEIANPRSDEGGWTSLQTRRAV